MPSILESRLQVKSNYRKILSAVSRLGLANFTAIHRAVGCSTRTLAKHLSDLTRDGLIEKRGRRYSITALGVHSISKFEEQLKNYRAHKPVVEPKKQFGCTVEVARFSRSGQITMGVLRAVVTKQLRPSERRKIDRALIKMIRIISSALPDVTERYRVFLTGGRGS
jgi:predicted transcriptional regulator